MSLAPDAPTVTVTHTSRETGCSKVPQTWRMTGKGRFYLHCPGCDLLAMDPQRRSTAYTKPLK